jgi:hypothetical protein
MPNSTAFDATKMVLSVLTTVCVALAGFSLKQTFHQNAKIAAMEAARVERDKTIDEKLNKLSEQSEVDASQNRQLSKQWKLHSWARGRVNHLEHKAGDRPSDWPDLDYE